MRLLRLAFIVASAGIVIGPAHGDTWSLQGSTMRLTEDGKKRIISYEIPRAPLLQMGVQSGTVFFVGEQDGRSYRGTAHAFYPKCAPLPYQVEGNLSEDNQHLRLQGKRPQADDSCQVQSYQDHLIELKYSHAPNPSAAQRYGDVVVIPPSKYTPAPGTEAPRPTATPPAIATAPSTEAPRPTATPPADALTPAKPILLVLCAFGVLVGLIFYFRRSEDEAPRDRPPGHDGEALAPLKLRDNYVPSKQREDGALLSLPAFAGSAVEQLDDFWRDALRTNGHDNQRKYADLIKRVQAQVSHLPQAEQDRLATQLVNRNAEYIAIAQRDREALKVRLGLPLPVSSAATDRLAQVAADTVVRATIWHSVAALFRAFR